MGGMRGRNLSCRHHGEVHGESPVSKKQLAMGTRVQTIVLFMVDQLAAKWVETCLNGTAPLPNLTRLRTRGTTFRQTISSNPICSPARATIATGLATRGHGAAERF